MLTTGGVFVTVIDATAILVDPSASVMDAVIVCAPFDRRRVKLPPLPIAPSLLEIQAIEPLRLPWSKSLATPVNWIRSVVLNVVPFAGLEIEIVGGVLPTVTVTDTVAVAPSESVIEAVIVWVPFVSPLVKVPPVPSAPSRLDVHAIEPVRLPCSKSHGLGLLGNLAH